MAKETLLGVNDVAHNVPKIYIGDNNALARNIRRAYLGIGDVAMRVFERYHINYVSLGDSIAAGHTINGDWASDYGEGSQYGVNGNKETKIVANSYTALVRDELFSIYGESHVSVKSFARSGDKVEDLIEKLSHATVINAIEDADLVTICIGANSLLGPALSKIEDYIDTGSFETIEAAVNENLTILETDSNPSSFKRLFDRLNEINPNAKYVFTTIYNPFKYLYLEEGRNGFFKPVLSVIPEMNIDVDEIIEDMYGLDDIAYWDILKWEWVPIELELDVDGLIKDSLLSTPAVQTLFNRVNAIGDWTESYINKLNKIMRDKINSYQAINTNFGLAETKVLFDLFPDKTDSRSDVDYGDLVNVEFTRNFDTMKMDWGELYEGTDAGTFWNNLAWKYLTFTNAVPSLNVGDYVSFDINGYAADLVAQIVEKVIVPDLDPHPEYRGHQVLKRSFTNMLGLVKYNSNGGTYVQDEFVIAGNKPKSIAPTKENSEFVGWYMDEGLKNPLDPNNTDFTDYNANLTLSDLVSGSMVIPKMVRTTTLHAKWTFVIILQLGDNEGAKFFIETEDGIFSIDNVVELEGELSNGKFIIDLV